MSVEFELDGIVPLPRIVVGTRITPIGEVAVTMNGCDVLYIHPTGRVTRATLSTALRPLFEERSENGRCLLFDANTVTYGEN